MEEILSQLDVRLIIRLLVAAACGGAIGYERDHRNKDAGLKTHMILAMGAALAMMISKYGFQDTTGFDTARLAAQVISGIGFLGAGVIFVKNNNLVSGLTTAAGLWTTSIIGLALGAGMYVMALITTAIVVMIQLVLHQKIFEQAIRKEEIYLTVTIKNMEVIEDITNYFKDKDEVSHEIISINKVKGNYEVTLDFISDSKTDTVEFARYLSSLDMVDEFHF